VEASESPAEPAHDEVARPRIDAFFAADRAESLNGKLYVMGGGFDWLAVPEFPAANVVFWFAAILRVPWGDTNRRLAISGRAYTEDREDLNWRLDGQIEAGRPAGRRGGDMILPVSGPVGVSLREAGRVIVTLSFAGDEKSFSIDVRRAQPQPPGQPPAA
jgi:hypothetical protein